MSRRWASDTGHRQPSTPLVSTPGTVAGGMGTATAISNISGPGNIRERRDAALLILQRPRVRCGLVKTVRSARTTRHAKRILGPQTIFGDVDYLGPRPLGELLDGTLRAGLAAPANGAGSELVLCVRHGV